MTKNWKYMLLVVSFFTVSAAYAQRGNEGQRAVEMERYSEAKRAYKNQIKSNPTEEAYIGLGDLYLKIENPDSAAYFYNQAASRSSKKSAIGSVAAGKAMLAKGNEAEAKRQFDEALKISKKRDPKIMLMIADAYVNSSTKNVAPAIDNINEALKKDKNNPAAYVLLGDAYQKQNNFGEAMNNYEKAIALDKNNVTAYMRRGELNVRSRNYNDARDAFQALIAVDPNYAPAYRDLGEMYYYVGQYDLALQNFKKYVDMAENTPETRAKYASFLFLTKDYPATLTEARGVLEKDPNNTVMRRLVAYSLYETGDNDKALAAMDEYFKDTDPAKLIANDYLYYGKIQAKAGRDDAAIINLNRAMEMDTANAALSDEIAQIYIKQKNYPKAIEVYRRKIDTSPGKPSNVDLYRLGKAYEGNKVYETADSVYAIITASVPNYAYGHLWRAMANYYLDPQTEKGLAKPHFEEFIKLANEDKEKYKRDLIQANSYMGFYYYKKGDKTNSLKHWREVQALEPGNQQAKVAIDDLTGKNKPAAKQAPKKK